MLTLRSIQALEGPNLDSIESLEAEQHFGTYTRVVALYLEDVRGRVVHSNGVGVVNTIAQSTPKPQQ